MESFRPFRKVRSAVISREADLQPHRSKYWLNTKEKCQETFDQQVQLVCQTYLEAPELYFQAHTHTVSVDEMPGIQAIERIANNDSDAARQTRTDRIRVPTAWDTLFDRQLGCGDAAR